jgi:hypothetical protein
MSRAASVLAPSDDRAILSFSLLLAALVAGVVLSLGQAEPASLSTLFSLLN